MNSEVKMISVIVPVYNEEQGIQELHRRLTASLEKFSAGAKIQYEIIYVDDGSTDGSLNLLRKFIGDPPCVRVVELLRNFGQHMAIFAGMEVARGDVIVTLDADLQNPPEEIPKLVTKMHEGYDVVGGWRMEREDSLWRRLFSRLMNKMISRATGVSLQDYGCMLRAYSKDVVNAMRQSRETVTYIPALANSFAKKVAEVHVEHAPRTVGKSKYNFMNLLRLYFDLLTGFSLLPIQLIGLAGAMVALAGVLFGLFLFVRRLIVGPEVEGVFTLFAILFIFVGIEILAMAMIGEYVGRIYMSVKGRPPYMIRTVYAQENEEERP